MTKTTTSIRGLKGLSFGVSHWAGSGVFSFCFYPSLTISLAIGQGSAKRSASWLLIASAPSELWPGVRSEYSGYQGEPLQGSAFRIEASCSARIGSMFFFWWKLRTGKKSIGYAESDLWWYPWAHGLVTGLAMMSWKHEIMEGGHGCCQHQAWWNQSL